MAWQIVVNGSPLLTEGTFTDFQKLKKRLDAMTRQGMFAESDDVRAGKVPDAPDPVVPPSEPVIHSEKRVVYTYERKLHHNVVMATAILIGMVIGFVLRGLL